MVDLPKEELPMDTVFPELSEQARQLLSRDFLYDDPASYRAGIEQCLLC